MRKQRNVIISKKNVYIIMLDVNKIFYFFTKTLIYAIITRLNLTENFSRFCVNEKSQLCGLAYFGYMQMHTMNRSKSIVTFCKNSINDFVECYVRK